MIDVLHIAQFSHSVAQQGMAALDAFHQKKKKHDTEEAASGEERPATQFDPEVQYPDPMQKKRNGNFVQAARNLEAYAQQRVDETRQQSQQRRDRQQARNA